MARKKRSLPVRPRPGDLQQAPETDAVRLPPREEAERPRSSSTKPSADASQEGNVIELTRDLDDESVRTLEKNAARTQPRAAQHRHSSR